MRAAFFLLIIMALLSCGKSGNDRPSGGNNSSNDPGDSSGDTNPGNNESDHSGSTMEGISLMSFNIAMDNANDGINRWDNRKEWITDFIGNQRIDLIGFQEAYYPQYTYLRDNLTQYETIGPKEGWQGAESVAIFYRKDKFELVDYGTFWLSETPDVQSLGWDAELRRTASWAKLKSKETKHEIYFFTTHLDHKGNQARLEGMKLILAKVKEFSHSGETLAFVTGDFNQRPDQFLYSMMVDGKQGLPAMIDTKKIAEEMDGENSWTFHGFGERSEKDLIWIDYIFANKEIEVPVYTNYFDQKDELYLSDHNPQIIHFNY